MTDALQESFEQLEAVQYLIEDSELALIELGVKLRDHQGYYSISRDYAGIQSDNVEPSRIFAYVSEQMYTNHLVAMEYVRVKTNLIYLVSKANTLWPTKK